MRKQGLIVLVVLAALVILLNTVATDRWIERRLEKFASRLNGARVELERFDFSPFGLSVGWEGLQVTDPEDTWHNLFETGRSSFDLALGPLLKRKFLVENFEMQDLRFGTERKTDGSLPGGGKKRSPGESAVVQMVQRNVEAEIERYPLLDLTVLQGKIDIEEIWDAAALKSPERLRSLIDRTEQHYEEWVVRLESLPTQEDIRALGRDIDSINADQIDTPQEVQSSYDMLRSIRERAEEYQKLLAQSALDFDRQRVDLSGMQYEIAEWVREDAQRLAEMAGIPELSRESIARMLFGERFARRMEKTLQVLGKVRTYSSKVGAYVPAKELPPRRKGQDIRFPGAVEYPGLWIKKIHLSGQTPSGLSLEGSLRDVVSNQKIIDRPTVIKLGGERTDGAGLDFSGLVDGRSEIPREQFGLQLRGLPLQGQPLTEFPLLPYRVSGGTAALRGSVDFEGGDFLLEMQFSAGDVAFDTSVRPQGMSDELYQVSVMLARSIDEVELTAAVRQSGDDFRMDIRSNLDSLMLETLRGVLSESVREARDELERRVERSIASLKNEIETLAVKEALLAGSIEQRRQLVLEQLVRIDERKAELDRRVKEQEDRLRRQLETQLEERKDRAGDRTKELLDSLFE
jgi:uncharacterized protein (TIGR03545 family)